MTDSNAPFTRAEEDTFTLATMGLTAMILRAGGEPLTFSADEFDKIVEIRGKHLEVNFDHDAGTITFSIV